MRRLECSMLRCAAAVTAVAAIVLFPAAVQAQEQPAIVVSGGGVGEFLDPNPCDLFDPVGPYGVSNFAVSATISDDGTVDGTFMCQVKGCVVIVQGVFTQVLGIDRADGDGEPDGVFLMGEAAFVDLSAEAGGPGLVMTEEGVPYLFDFCIELREGPSSSMQGVPDGVPLGRFFYTDEVVLLGAGIVYPGGVDDGFDQEELRKGHIQIDFKGDIADIPFDRVEDCPVEPLE